MRMLRVALPFGAAALVSTLAFATSGEETNLLRPYLGALQRLCEDALDTDRCDAIDDIGDYASEGESRQDACNDLDALVRRCENDLWEGHVTCRIFGALADDACEGGLPRGGGNWWDEDHEQVCGRVPVDEVLGVDEHVRSCDGRFDLIMQGDGNLVLYQNEQPLWDTGTWNHPGATAVMQGDGNLVVYGPDGAPLWDSGTWGHPGAALSIQDDGNVVIYDTNGAAIWSSGTCCR